MKPRCNQDRYMPPPERGRRVRGLSEMWRMRFEVCLTEKAADLEIRLLACRLRLAGARKATYEAEAACRRAAEGGPPEHAVAKTPEEVQQPQPVVQPHITDEDIEMMAVRSVTEAARLSPSLAEEFWARWRDEAKKRLPEYAANELIQRARTLQYMSGKR